MLANSQTLSNDLYDPETGQELFKPQVGRGPRKVRRPPPKGTNTAEMLYQKGRQTQAKKFHKEVANVMDHKAQQNTVFTTNQTKKIMDARKKESFNLIFGWLDSDNDGQISPQKIDISMIEPDLLEVLSPLFCEMEELCQALD